jgi:hypothetical protein
MTPAAVAAVIVGMLAIADGPLTFHREIPRVSYL